MDVGGDVALLLHMVVFRGVKLVLIKNVMVELEDYVNFFLSLSV